MCVYMKPVKIYVHLYKLDWETVYIRTVYAVHFNKFVSFSILDVQQILF
jgi:hypothetical protein